MSDVAATHACAVLVVQRDRRLLAALVADLRQFGIDAEGVHSFEEARREFATRRWDVLVADVRLGAYNGLQLAVRIRAAQPNVVVILTGEHVDPALEVEAAAVQAHYVVDVTSGAIAALVLAACGRATIAAAAADEAAAAHVAQADTSADPASAEGIAGARA
jgi:DNA-binding NtrC family response regulator